MVWSPQSINLSHNVVQRCEKWEGEKVRNTSLALALIWRKRPTHGDSNHSKDTDNREMHANSQYTWGQVRTNLYTSLLVEDETLEVNANYVGRVSSETLRTCLLVILFLCVVWSSLESGWRRGKTSLEATYRQHSRGRGGQWDEKSLWSWSCLVIRRPCGSHFPNLRWRRAPVLVKVIRESCASRPLPLLHRYLSKFIGCRLLPEHSGCAVTCR